MKKILCIVGTRPEAIKMAPIILALKRNPEVVCHVLATAQHRQMLDQVLSVFGIVPDVDLDIMQANQQLPELTSRLLIKLDNVMANLEPDVVLAQGDTTTVMVAALASFYRKIPFGHVEAGLRTHNLFNPYPEEANRVIAGHLSKWHFAPTSESKENLLREGISDASVYITGNTVIDALMVGAEQCSAYAPEVPDGKKLILVTAHRRENFGQGMENICEAILQLVSRRNDVHVLFPVHPNPNVTDIVRRTLSQHTAVSLCSPLDYLPFVAAMKSSYFVLTDSGGVQEEAPALGKPVLVLRNETERPEAVALGLVKLVGTDVDRIVSNCEELLSNKATYARMAGGASPYGDGHAAQRIVEIIVANNY
jgi:UDP-N-acetylglucosamine 2-epimerase (non-hydrolysing)